MHMLSILAWTLASAHAALGISASSSGFIKVAKPSSARISSSSSAASAVNHTVPTSTLASVVPSPSVTAISLSQALSDMYDFDPGYNLSAPADSVGPNTCCQGSTCTVTCQSVWQQRQMKAWSRYYIDSWWKGPTAGNFMQQLLAQPEIGWSAGQCDLSSGSSSCADIPLGRIAINASPGGGPMTNQVLNAHLLWLAVAGLRPTFSVLSAHSNWNAGMNSLATGIQEAQWTNSASIADVASALLPPATDPVGASDIGFFLDIASLVLLVMPELGIVDGIADIAVSKAVDDATTAADAASADLMNEYSAVLGASAYKEGASDAVNNFAQAFKNMALQQYGTLFDDVEKELMTATASATANGALYSEWINSAFETGSSFAAGIASLIGDINNLTNSANGGASVTALQLGQEASNQLGNWQSNVGVIYTASVSPTQVYAAGGIWSLIANGGFMQVPPNDLISGLQTTFNNYILQWTFWTAFKGKQVVIYKQSFPDLPTCQSAMALLPAGMSGQVCIGSSSSTAASVPERAHDNDPSLTYLFFPTTMQSTGSGLYTTPPVTITGDFSSYNGGTTGSLPDAAVPGFGSQTWGSGGALAPYDLPTFYWNVWWNSAAGQADSATVGTSGSELWTMPSPETAGNQAPFGFPLLDVNNNNAVAYMTNWPQWCNFRYNQGAPYVGMDQFEFWLVKLADIAVQMNYTTYAAMATAWGVDYMGFCIQGQTNGCNAYGGLPYARPDDVMYQLAPGISYQGGTC